MYCGGPLSLAYNMAACNKLPAACPQDDWVLLFVLLSLYYYRRACLYGHIKAANARGPAKQRACVRAPRVIQLNRLTVLPYPSCCHFTTLSIIRRGWTR